MRSLFTLGTLCLLLSLPFTTAEAAIVVPKKGETTQVEQQQSEEKALSKRELRQQKREMRRQQRKERREMRKALRQHVKELRKENASDNAVLLIILAILIPPLAMFLYDGLSDRFWISLLLTLLFFLPGMIYTLIVLISEN